MGMSLKQIRYLYAIGVFKRNPDSKGLGKTQSLSENKLKTMRAIGKAGASLKVGEVSTTHRVKIGDETFPIQKHKNESVYPVVNGKMLGSKDLPDKPMSLVRTDIKAKKSEKKLRSGTQVEPDPFPGYSRENLERGSQSATDRINSLTSGQQFGYRPKEKLLIGEVSHDLMRGNGATLVTVNHRVTRLDDLPPGDLAILHPVKDELPEIKKVPVKALTLSDVVDDSSARTFTEQITSQIVSAVKKVDDQPDPKLLDQLIELAEPTGRSKSKSIQLIAMTALQEIAFHKADLVGLEIDKQTTVESGHDVLAKAANNPNPYFEVDFMDTPPTDLKLRVDTATRKLSSWFPESTGNSGMMYSFEINPTYQRESASNGMIRLNKDTTEKTVIHEMGHLLEGPSLGWRGLVKNFLEDVSDTSKTEKLSVITGNPVYADDEIAYRVKPGKSVANPYVLKKYTTSDSEVISMGFDRLYKDPIKFRRKYPDHFRLAVAALHMPMFPYDL